jgi:hypothetical protein
MTIRESNEPGHELNRVLCKDPDESGHRAIHAAQVYCKALGKGAFEIASTGRGARLSETVGGGIAVFCRLCGQSETLPPLPRTRS